MPENGAGDDQLRAALDTIQDQRAKISGLLREKHEPIAVVGVGIRFPGSNDNLDDLAEFLRAGRSGMRPIPEDRWDLDTFTPDGDDTAGRVRTAAVGFLDQIDQFDPQFFNISPKEAPWVDPQQRLLLEASWEALENANIDPGTLRHGNGGVYVGTSSIDYALELDSVPYQDLDGRLATGITAYPMSGRLSYFLGWRGPSMSVDTACASSLTALHYAVADLRRGDCDIALAAAVNCLHHPRIFVVFSEGNMLAPDGRCKTFDESADGYARAEGCAALLLKRFSDARRDGDTILALVRGTAVRQDGASAGLSVPNGASQELVIKAALRNAMLEPKDIQYVEAHGTGTPLGDPIEMGAICDVFSASHTKDDPLTVGSIKTNVGHMEPAAGLGGVVKCILQLRDGVMFPHINFSTPSGRIPWDAYPVTVPTECVPWTAEPRRAVVNSFGFAGAVAAAVLEQAPARRAADPAGRGGGHESGHVFTLSAKSRRALRMQIERYQKHLAEHPDIDLGDLCYTANVARSHFSHRLAGLVRDRDGLNSLLEREIARLDERAAGLGDIRKVAFLFTGQGAQYAGMGAALYREYPVFRGHVDECDRLFQPHLGRSIRDLMLGETDDPEAIHQTRYTQPALFTLEYALAKLWMSWGVKPNMVLGHSIGEVVAAAVAGLFTVDDAVRLVAVRGRLMQAVPTPGGMAAVTAPAAEVAPLLEGRANLAIAAINAPNQCVISGESAALAETVETLRERGVSVKELVVSQAFHSPLMTEVFDEFAAAIAEIRFREPRITLISNLTGEVARRAEVGRTEYWVRHIGEPVNFVAGMHTVEQRGRHVFIEVGPSTALTSLARQCVAADEHRWISSMHPKDPVGATLRTATAQLYQAGLALSWPDIHGGHSHERVPLPTYAFDRKRYWLPQKNRHGVTQLATGQAVHPLLGKEITTPEQAALGEREFATRLGPDQPAYLRDHVVMGQVVFPATGYVEILLALRDTLYGDSRRAVTGISLREAMFLSDDEFTDVRVRLRPGAEGAMDAEVVSRVAGRDGVIERHHVTAVLAAPADPDVCLSPAGWELAVLAGDAREPDETYDHESVYAAYSGAGLDYGPEFRRMRRVDRYGTDIAVGELAGLAAGPLDLAPPAVVDAATHVMSVLADDGNSYVPARIEQFRLFKKPKADTLRAVMRLVPPPESVDLCADLIVFERDVPVFELCGLGLKRVGSSIAGGRRHFFHELRWVKKSLVPQGVKGTKRVLVVGRDEADLVPLVDSAAQSGVALSFAGGVAEVAGILAAEPVTDLCWFWRAQPGKVSAAALRAECERNYRDLLDLLATLTVAGFGHNQRLWLVTERAQWLPGDQPGTGERLAAASLWGFGHVVLNEYPAYRTTLVDLPVMDYRPLLEEWQSRDAGEFQVAYRSGHRHVRRLVGSNPTAHRDDNVELAISAYGQFADIVPVPAPDVAPAGDQIQVRVHAAGLNFKDVLNALGMLTEFGEQPLGFECAGTVVAAGPDAEFAPGDEVIVNYPGAMRRRVTVPSAAAVRKPQNVNFILAAGLMSVYVTAYYALHHLAGMRAGDRVLIHSAAGGVGQAAVHLAKAAGAEVFATASPHKWPLLESQGVRHVMSSRSLDFADEIAEITGGAGVDIVLNSLNKDFIPAGMRCLAANGRFVELGKVGAWTTEQVREVRPDVTYFNFDLSELPEEQVLPINKEIMGTVAAMVAGGELPPISTTRYTLDEVAEAFSVLSRGANVGKLVLSFIDERAIRARDVTISPHKTYLITGGLGALGLVTADRLVSSGARHIALMSRGGVPAAEVAHLCQRVADRASVTVFQGDVASPADVERVIAALRDGAYPLGGIVHAAGSVNDMPLSAQTWETMDEVLAPKVYGTWLLHETTKSLPGLDFFVGYSSGGSVIGPPTQSNYAAANAFMDNLLIWRAAQGRPGLSINWGPWAEVGMSARLSDVMIKRWDDEGVKLFTPAKGTRAMISLLGAGVAQVTAGECDWDRFVAARPVDNALYRLLLHGSDAGTRGIDLDALLAQPAKERVETIGAYVRRKIADVLHMDDPDGVDAHTEFVQLGLDSLVAVELKNALESAFRIPLPPSLAFDHPSAAQLTEFLNQQLVSGQAA
jgi:acyl transferase domain-containing protein/NADPH:quinone reductase-like Zn-dependent oxidoreductase/acyl carrier protein